MLDYNIGSIDQFLVDYINRPMEKSCSYQKEYLKIFKKYLNIMLNDQLPVGLLAQLVRALHRYRRGHGFESRISLNFFF